MRRFVDLHTHSTASDGSCLPQALIRLADEAGLAAVALTDHDTTAGLAAARKAAEERPNLQFLPGIEVSAKCDRGTLHILGLGVDELCEVLQEMLARLRAARDRRNPKIVARLREMGIEIAMDEVLAVARRGTEDLPPGDVVSRLHIAEVLQRKGFTRSTDEAFERLIGKGQPGYVERERPSPREAITAIHSAGGVAALAHPPQLNCTNYAQLEQTLRGMIRDGLDGLEVYHRDHTPAQTRHYLKLAGRYGLAVAGGSDFHGAAKGEAVLGRPRVPMAAVTGRLAEFLRSGR